MIPKRMLLIAFAICFNAAFSFDAEGQDANRDETVFFDGLWSGSWGGGEQGAVTYQPVIAQMLIENGFVEIGGFRKVGTVTGTVRFDTEAKRMRIQPAAKGTDQPTPKAITFTYEIQGDKLKLFDTDRFPITLAKVPTARVPLGNATVELAEAVKINDKGELFVTKFSVLQPGRSGIAYYRPEYRLLQTTGATVRLVGNSTSKKVSIDDARKLIRKSTPVAIMYRSDELQVKRQTHQLWKVTVPPSPDSEAVWRTLARTLRPGTLVFILSARQNVPQP